MNKRKTLYPVLIFSTLLLFFSLTFNSCYGPNDNEPAKDGHGIISGKIIDMNGIGLSGVIVECSGKTTYSNAEGSFKLQGLPAGNRKLVNFSKSSYVGTQKIVKITDYKNSYLEAALSTIGTVTTFNASTPSSISTNGVKVDLQASGLVDTKGNIFSGTATAKLTYFNPKATYFNDAFPGEFAGIGTDNQETPIESFGFIDVEIYNGTEKLQLAQGKPAAITMPIPAAMLAQAPATIPLWYYDMDKGQWKEYGSANKVGNQYIGTVTHFSRINLDMKVEESSAINGRVVDQDGNPLANAWIKLTGIDFTGGGAGYTDNDGRFEFIRIKANSQIRLYAYSGGFYSAPLDETTPSVGQNKNIGDIVIVIDPNKVSGWTELSGTPQKTITDMQFINETTGWIVAGSIYRTDDGGASWIMQKDGDSGSDSGAIRSLFMIDANLGWAVGRKVYQTVDGGANWVDVQVDTSKTPLYADVFFLNSSTGWILSNYLYKTTDGGGTWINQGNGGSGSNQEYNGKLFFIDANTGWMISTNKIKRTEDGGDTWTDLTIPNIKYGLSSMQFLDANKGFVIYSGYREDSKIFYTADGGDSWVEQPHSAITALYDVFFVDSQNGWIVGAAGTILHSTDGGLTWNPQFNKATGNLTKVCFVNTLVGWASGSLSSKGQLLFTDTGGDAQ